MKNPFGLIGKGLKEIAPHLAKAAIGFIPGGSALTSVLGREAIKRVAGVLGVDIADSDDDTTVAARMEQVINNELTPDQVTELQKIDKNFKIERQKLLNERTSIFARDRADAREKISNSSYAEIRYAGVLIASLLIITYCGLIVWICYSLLMSPHNIEPTSLNIVLAILNGIGALATAVVGAYCGGLLSANGNGNGNGTTPVKSPRSKR